MEGGSRSGEGHADQLQLQRLRCRSPGRAWPPGSNRRLGGVLARTVTVEAELEVSDLVGDAGVTEPTEGLASLAQHVGERRFQHTRLDDDRNVPTSRRPYRRRPRNGT